MTESTVDGVQGFGFMLGSILGAEEIGPGIVFAP
jgi:hypothetical protein